MVESGMAKAGPARSPRWRAGSGAGLLALVVALGWALPSLGQTLNDRLSRFARTSQSEKAPLIVDADQLIYDNDRNRVMAVGNAQLYHKGKVLEADKVTYDRTTNRVIAEGNVKLTDETGTITRGTKMELTDDFKDGFIQALRIEHPVLREGKKTTARFSAPFAERAGGETTTFQSGTYTACEPCKDNPDRPPFWRIRAKKIIHNNTERTVYYEDARFELFGMPIAWLPYFASPDPTVKRQTGFLTPRYIASSSLGTGISLPYYWAIAPNFDLTVTPTLLSRQGVKGEVEWRHRLMHGAYSIRAAGIFQQDQSAFSLPPFGPRGKNFRGAVETHGQFFINERWKFGWDVTAISDRWFLDHYRFKASTVQSDAVYGFFRESTSALYLTGKSDRAWFDMRGFHFQGLSYQDFQQQQPLIHPVLDYNRRFDGPSFLGGEVTLDANYVSLSRNTAQFAEIPRQKTFLVNGFTLTGEPFSLFDGCAVFVRGQCLVRGIAGNINRFSTSVSWRRNFVDPLGQVWMPYGSLRLDAFSINPDTSGAFNANIANFMPADNQVFARAMPTIGLLYRYPFVAATPNFTHVIEPVAQIVARPSEQRISQLPNEDAQSLVFDDTNLFSWNRFSGYDRSEGGTRASVGARYTATGSNGAYASLVFGQSFHLAGTNSFTGGDIANVGLNSGLDKPRSDYVGSLQIVPNRTFALIARGRFDQSNFGIRRLEIQSKANFGALQGSLLYARYAAQPQIGFPFLREGLLGQASLRLSENWQFSGSVLLDLDRYYQDRAKFNDDLLAGLIPPGSIFRKRTIVPAAMTVGLKYEDDCTIFGVQYMTAYRDGADGTRTPNQTVLLRLEFKTLGETSFRRSLTSTPLRQDGIQQ